MSFILDALRKVDRSKDSAAARPEDLVVMEGGRQWGSSRRALPMTLVALSLVALGVSVYALVRTLSPRQATPSAPVTAPPSAAAPTPQSPAFEEPSPPPDLQRAEPPDPSPSRAPQVAVEVPAEPEPAPVPPIRLVGRGSSAAAPSKEEAPTGEPSAAELGLPPLVLQGTSVVNDRPVAVVNYQRVFEGDFVEGARVVRIADRLVELEFEGRRFTLRF
jgi:hypothetical protein